MIELLFVASGFKEQVANSSDAVGVVGEASFEPGEAGSGGREVRGHDREAEPAFSGEWALDRMTYGVPLRGLSAAVDVRGVSIRGGLCLTALTAPSRCSPCVVSGRSYLKCRSPPVRSRRLPTTDRRCDW